MNGQPTSAKTDARGTIHLVFDSPDGPNYVNSNDDGKTFSRPIALVDSASMKPGLEFTTWDMAVTDEGTVHVALGNNAWKMKLPKDEWGFFYTRRRPDEKAFSPLKNINHKPSEGFSLAANGKGLVSVIWMADRLFANVSHDGGETFGSGSEIDSKLDPCNCCTTCSVYGPDGRLAILYREETDNQRDMYVALWDQKKSRVSRVRVSTIPWKIDSCPMTYYSITRTETGYLAAWPTKGQIYFAHLDSNGSLLKPKEFKTPGMNGMRTGILAISASQGRSLVAWKKDKKLGWQLYDQFDQPTGSIGTISSEGNGVAGVATKNGDLILFQ